MADSPWWAIPALSGAFAFVGVLMAQFVTVYLDRRRSRREDHQRWHGERRVAYGAFMKALRQSESAFLDALDDPDPAINAEAAESLRSHQAEALLGEIELLATEKVAGTASAAYGAHTGMSSWRTYRDSEGHHDGFRDLRDRAHEAQAEFLKLARIELGITKPEKKFRVEADSIFGVLGEATSLMSGAVLATLGIGRRR